MLLIQLANQSVRFVVVKKMDNVALNTVTYCIAFTAVHRLIDNPDPAACRVEMRWKAGTERRRKV